MLTYCDYRSFLKIYISHGSAATQLRCGGSGIFINHFISNFPQNEEKRNRSLFGKVMDKTLRLTFWPTLCTEKADK